MATLLHWRWWEVNNRFVVFIRHNRGFTMSVEVKQSSKKSYPNEGVKTGIELLSQQIWCWGRDILRVNGNWLIDLGFEVIYPPVEMEKVKNIYLYQISEFQRIMLRGFGVFFTDDRYGSIFVPRYEFIPKFAPVNGFNILPWGVDDVSEFNTPNTVEKEYCTTMLGELIDWIITYEKDTLAILGLDYRLEVLDLWHNGKRRVFSPQDSISGWMQIRKDIEKILNFQDSSISH